MRSEDEMLSAQQRKHNFNVKGAVYDDYLDPALGTEMALAMDRYYGWATPHGSGFAHHFRAVPHEVVLDLLEDMGNVAELRKANHEKVASEYRIVIDRIEKVIEWD